MTDLDQVVTRLAVITALEQKLAEAKKATKAELESRLPRGTVYAFDKLGDNDDAHQLGYATVPKPSKPKPQITIDDESEVFAWMVDMFGDSAIETKVQLTEQGWESLRQYVAGQVALADPFPANPIPGVTVTIPEPRPATPRFTPSKTVGAQVEAMVAAGLLNIADVLALPAPDPAN